LTIYNGSIERRATSSSIWSLRPNISISPRWRPDQISVRILDQIGVRNIPPFPAALPSSRPRRHPRSWRQARRAGQASRADCRAGRRGGQAEAPAHAEGRQARQTRGPAKAKATRPYGRQVRGAACDCQGGLGSRFVSCCRRDREPMLAPRPPTPSSETHSELSNLISLRGRPLVRFLAPKASLN
jgi:hypothetical protein